MPGGIRSYRDLAVWQEAMVLAEEVYRLAATLPASERFGLAVQLRRGAVSIASNIAEGHARYGTREFLRFLAIANGSLMELETQLLLAGRLKLVSGSCQDSALERCGRVSRMLAGLRSSLQRREARRANPSR